MLFCVALRCVMLCVVTLVCVLFQYGGLFFVELFCVVLLCAWLCDVVYSCCVALRCVVLFFVCFGGIVLRCLMRCCVVSFVFSFCFGV